ncbi:MAG: glycosyltransferase family 39 protein [Theionarchaea archaeon]|nr:glycosyltransferase family 39 protein [Theionarchaea archaeon]
MKVSAYKFTIACGILAILVIVGIPFSLLSLFLVLYFPGILLASFIKREFDVIEGIFLPFLMGICFWIVFSYFVSDIKVLHWITVILISFLSAYAADRRNIHFNLTNQYELALLVICCLFMVSYSYPWFQFFQWVPPGDDMKYHMMHIETIGLTHSLPENYGELYPEVDALTYPLGYHIIAALSTFSSVSLSSVTFSTLFISLLTCFSFYFLGKELFNQKTGLYSAFSASFLSLFFHRLLTTSTYPNVLAISLQVFALFLLCKTLKSPSRSLILLTGLGFAASGETHTYILLLNMILFTFLFLISLKRDSQMKSLLYTGSVFLFLMVPYFVRLHFDTPSPVEMVTYTVWYLEDSFRSLSDFIRNIQILSPLLLLFGIMGGFAVKRNRIVGSWVAAILVIPALSFLQIQYPGWYSISPNRFFFHLCAPLCILSGKFFADTENVLSRKRFFVFLVMVGLLSTGMHHLNLFRSFLPDPVSEVQMNADDAFVMEWISKNTREDTIILNTGPTVDCSSWVPILSGRRVVFPSFSGHRGDNCIEKVGAHRKRVDLFIVTYAPDSDMALQVLKKYNIEYIYVPAWVKRFYLDVYPQKLLESPLYTPVVKKGNAYLFRVNYDEKPDTVYVIIHENGPVRMKGGHASELSFSPLLSPDVQGQFYLRISYTDDVHGKIDMSEEGSYLGTIFTYGTGENKTMMYPLSGMNTIDLSFYPDYDFFLDEVTLLFGFKGINLTDQLGLKGEWTKKDSGTIIAPAHDSGLRLYLFNSGRGELVITYKDIGYGNVDINVPTTAGSWDTVLIIRRENSGDTKEVTIQLDTEYSLFVLGFYVYGDDFLIEDVQNIQEP